VVLEEVDMRLIQWKDQIPMPRPPSIEEVAIIELIIDNALEYTTIPDAYDSFIKPYLQNMLNIKEDATGLMAQVSSSHTGEEIEAVMASGTYNDFLPELNLLLRDAALIYIETMLCAMKGGTNGQRTD